MDHFHPSDLVNRVCRGGGRTKIEQQEEFKQDNEKTWWLSEEIQENTTKSVVAKKTEGQCYLIDYLIE